MILLQLTTVLWRRLKNTMLIVLVKRWPSTRTRLKVFAQRINLGRDTIGIRNSNKWSHIKIRFASNQAQCAIYIKIVQIGLRCARLRFNHRRCVWVCFICSRLFFKLCETLLRSRRSLIFCDSISSDDDMRVSSIKRCFYIIKRCIIYLLFITKSHATNQ